MQVTDLKYHQKKNTGYVTVTFDDTSVITLDAELAVQFHIARGMEVSVQFRDTIIQADECLRARRKLIGYLSMRKKSSLEARRYLQKAGFKPDAIDEVVAVATKLSYINDSEFAQAFARNRQKTGKKGPRAVVAELQSKGISRDEAVRVTQAMNDTSTQLEQARRLAAKKYPTLKDDPDPIKSSRKLTQHLARRGFDPDICALITREFFGDPTVFD